MNLYILIGLPGAGKSTCSETIKNENTVIIASDDIREKLFGYKFNAQIKERVFEELINDSIKCLKNGMDVIVDTTFLNEKLYRDVFINEIDKQKIAVKKTALLIKTDIEECIARDQKRDIHRKVGRQIINDLNELLVFPEDDEKFDAIQIVK